MFFGRDQSRLRRHRGISRDRMAAPSDQNWGTRDAKSRFMQSNALARPVLFTTLALCLSGCRAIAGIFKAGAWTGAAIVLGALFVIGGIALAIGSRAQH